MHYRWTVVLFKKDYIHIINFKSYFFANLFYSYNKRKRDCKIFKFNEDESINFKDYGLIIDYNGHFSHD